LLLSVSYAFVSLTYASSAPLSILPRRMANADKRGPSLPGDGERASCVRLSVCVT
jgi:hypothetical protein